MSSRPEDISYSAQELKNQLVLTVKSAYNNGISLAFPNPMENISIKDHLEDKYGINIKKSMKNNNNNKNNSSLFSRLRSSSITMTFGIPCNEINKSNTHSKYKNFEKSVFKRISKDYDSLNDQLNNHFGKENINPFGNVFNYCNNINNNNNDKNGHLLEIEFGWNLDYFF